MQSVALAAGQVADALLLIRSTEVEAPDVRARRNLVLADADDVLAVRHLLPDVLRVVEFVSALIDVGDLDRVADIERAAIGFLAACDHPEERRLTGAVRTGDADDRAARNGAREIVDEESVAVRFADALHVEDLLAEAGSRRNVEFRGLVALLHFLRHQFLEASETRL